MLWKGWEGGEGEGVGTVPLGGPNPILLCLLNSVPQNIFSCPWILCIFKIYKYYFFLYKHWTSPWSSTMPSYQAFKCVLLLILISCHFLWFFINDFYWLIKEFESLIICLSFILMQSYFLVIYAQWIAYTNTGILLLLCKHV